MRRWPMRLPLLLALTLVAAAPCAAGASDGAAGRFITLDTYAADGPFVEWPAQAVGMTTLVLVGSTATFTCLPYDLLAGGVGRASFGSFAAFCATAVGGPVANGAYAVAGAPFWLVKQVAWDAPRRLFGCRRAGPPTP
jgi:hypothetical protein